MTMTTFGKALRIELKEAGLTREQFAEKMDIGVSTIQCWMSGKRIPRKNTLEKMAEVLDCTVEHLVGYF